MNKVVSVGLWAIMSFLAIGVGSYAATLILVPEIAPPFLQEGLANGDWRYYFHFLGGATALILGAIQFNNYLRTRFKNLHRWLGRIYLIAVLLSGFAGLLMAFSSAGNAFADIGFGALAICWLISAAMAFIKIRRGDIESHKKWMIRNYALTYAAVSLRVYLPLSLFVMQYEFDTAYAVIAWICWVPNLLIAEYLFVRKQVANNVPATQGI